jgi:hypothetical protein
MHDYEKLGLFYLGKRYDMEDGGVVEEPTLYDSKDLTTHAVIVGMTGSGKTGLGISLIEEAAIDRIPVIAIDPKGDLGNLLLTFPQLRPKDFRPWVDPGQAKQKGQTLDEYATNRADLWKKGLASWQQDGSRIEKFRSNVELGLGLFTPGSSAGTPISVLRSFQAPPQDLRQDRDLYQDHLQATAGSVLTLMGEDTDDLGDPRRVLIASILDHCWSEGRDLDLAGLFAAIQRPPFERIGLMPTDDFISPAARAKLAKSLNGLVAAPGFDVWMSGAPLRADSLLYNDAGKPRVSVVSIAHLDDKERMFFLTMLLSEIVAWMRTQPGTGSLRALIYIDEIFGFMPPTANPPTKKLLLTLLKQARAFGVGVVLSTQNPVDLDYKGLSNAGTWFIGRMQTERDVERLADGLRGASGGGPDDLRVDKTIASLGKRVFLLHNVHEKQPVIFHTRWAMSYLAGPLTRDQIKRLTASDDAIAASPPAAERKTIEAAAAVPPVPSGVDEFFLPVTRVQEEADSLVYRPMLLAAADVGYHSARYKVDDERRFLVLTEAGARPKVADWSDGDEMEMEIEDLESNGREGAGFEELPTVLRKKGSYTEATRAFKRWIREDQALTLLKSPTFKLMSSPAETERDFRIRLQTVASERRDQAAAALRKRYSAKLTTLRNRLLRAEQAVQRESEQARQSKLDSALSIGTALLGAFLGRKTVSTSSAGRIGTAVRKAGRVGKESSDVARARETATTVRQQIAAMEQELTAEIGKLDVEFDAQTEQLDEIRLRPKSTDTHIHFVALTWAPYLRKASGERVRAWS